MKIALFCLLGGVCFTASALRDGHFWWWWLVGVIVSTALLPVVRCGPRDAWAQFGSIAAVLVIVGVVCALPEGALYIPETRKTLVPAMIAGTVFYVLMAAALAILAKVLRLNAPSKLGVQMRSRARVIPIILLSGLSYVLYYAVFGGLTYQYFDRKYYPHAMEEIAALGNWFWAYEWGRGMLMILAVLPIIYTLRMTRKQAATAMGLLIGIVGSAALLVPSPVMVPNARYIVLAEIMIENVALGLTAVWLLRSPPNRSHSS